MLYVEDDQWPYPHNPMILGDDGSTLVPDTTVTVEAFQLRPLTWEAAAAWSGASYTDGVPALLVGPVVAVLGDYILRDADGFRVEPAAGFATRYRPVEPAEA